MRVLVSGPDKERRKKSKKKRTKEKWLFSSIIKGQKFQQEEKEESKQKAVGASVFLSRGVGRRIHQSCFRELDY